jgi:tRNA threonylcarbamoyladenosine biosynthesis protein TsaE
MNEPVDRVVLLDDPDASERFGSALGRWLEAFSGGVVYLEGGLGAGKTTIARALLRCLGVDGAIKSPTYTIMEPYEVAGRRVLHMDFYRIDEADFDQLGLDDYAPSETLWLVEWPERVKNVLPPADLRLRIAAVGQGRRVEISAAPGWRGPLAALKWP